MNHTAPRPRWLLRAFSGLLAVAVTATLCGLPHANAQGKGKPGGGDGGGSTPPPAGTIFFPYGGGILAMNPDGSGKSPTLLGGTVLSSLVYGNDPLSDRWWLVIAPDERTYDLWFNSTTGAFREDAPHQELFAVRVTADGEERVQLTDFYGSVVATGSPQWSNDGRDTFVSFVGTDISDAFSEDEDGDGGTVTSVDSTKWVRNVLYRIDLVPGAEPPFAFDHEFTVGQITPWASDSEAVPYHWSGDGNELVYRWQDSVDGPHKIFIQDILTGTDSLLWEIANTPYLGVRHLKWSPTDRRIVCHGRDRVNGFDLRGIWEIDLTGQNQHKLLLEGTGNNWYVEPDWSPDGTHIVFTLATERSGRPTEYKIGRLQLATSKTTYLTNDLNKTTRQGPARWLPNDVGP